MIEEGFTAAEDCSQQRREADFYLESTQFHQISAQLFWVRKRKNDRYRRANWVSNLGYVNFVVLYRKKRLVWNNNAVLLIRVTYIS